MTALEEESEMMMTKTITENGKRWRVLMLESLDKAPLSSLEDEQHHIPESDPRIQAFEDIRSAVQNSDGEEPSCDEVVSRVLLVLRATCP